jgi:hypothetical protein
MCVYVYKLKEEITHMISQTSLGCLRLEKNANHLSYLDDQSKIKQYEVKVEIQRVFSVEKAEAARSRVT